MSSRSLRHVRSAIVIAGAITELAACGERASTHRAANSGHELRSGAETICDPNTIALYLQLPAVGGFILNGVALDSTALAGWIARKLPQRPTRARLVLVGMDPSREAEVGWIVPAIEASGGSAYRADSAAAAACMTVASGSSGPRRLLANDR